MNNQENRTRAYGSYRNPAFFTVGTDVPLGERIGIVENEKRSSNRTPCLRRFRAFLFSSHSKRMAGFHEDSVHSEGLRGQYICTYIHSVEKW